MRMRALDLRKRYYCRLFDQAFSPDGQYLATGDAYGRITIFDLHDCLSSNYTDDKPRRPLFHLTPTNHSTPKDTQIYTLVSSSSHLIRGTISPKQEVGDSYGNILGYLWSDIAEHSSGIKPAFRFVATEAVQSVPGPYEVNALRLSKTGESLYSGGAGDNAVKVWRLEDGKLISSLVGHTDYIHAIALKDENELLSASEDGTVRLWDLRQKACAHTFVPSNNPECNRNNTYGPWIGCLDVEGGWMVCGGGPRLGIWHLTSMSLASTMHPEVEMTYHAVEMYDNKILVGGSIPRLFQYDHSGRPVADIDVNPSAVYGVGTNRSERNKITTCCGSSSNVDVFINLGYKSFSLNTY